MTRLADELHTIRYAPPCDFAALKKAAYQRERAELDRQWRSALGSENGGAPRGRDTDPIPTRITLSLDGATYRYGAITEDAAVPERAVPIDRTLVLEANDDLATEQGSAPGRARAFLREAAAPRDLGRAPRGHAPLVMLLDDETARSTGRWSGEPEPARTARRPGRRALYRLPRHEPRLHAPAPNAIRAAARPASAAPARPPGARRRRPRRGPPRCSGAIEEGRQVADLLDGFKPRARYARAPSRSPRLLGPVEATRTNVLRELTRACTTSCTSPGTAPTSRPPVAVGLGLLGDRRLIRRTSSPAWTASRSSSSPMRASRA